MKYFLFLKSKAGDFNSIKKIEGREVVPFFDLVSTGSGLDGVKLKAKVDKLVSDIKKFWPEEQLFFIDHYDISLSARMPGGAHPYASYSDLLQSGSNLGLVTGLDRDADYNNVLLGIAKKYPETPLAVRVCLDELDVPRLVFDDLVGLVDDFRPFSSHFFLVLDCRVIKSKEQADHAVEALARFIKMSIKCGLFEYIVIASSSIPEALMTLLKLALRGGWRGLKR